MNTDLQTQLAEYGRYQRAVRRTVELPDIQAAADGTEFQPYEGDLIMVDIQTRESESTRPDELHRRRRTGQAILAAAAVIVVIIAVTLFNDTEESLETDVANPPSPGETALAASDDFVEAFNRGDASAMLAALTPSAVVSEKYTGMSPDFEPMEPAFFEQHMAWATAQGTTWTSPECAVTDDTSAASVHVSCEFGWLYAPREAADEPPVPTALDLVITQDGISELAFEYPPEFGLFEFDQWVALNHPDGAPGLDFGDWNSVAEAEEGGALRAQYVAEWVASLEANS